MTALLQTLAAYVPPAAVRGILRERSPSPPAEATADRFPAAVLFADISGFTPLTEALAQRGPEGPEELTRLLNGYFGRMIALIEAEGGEVVKFSGDAVTVVFAAADESLPVATRRAAQAAEAMQAAMGEFARLEASVGPVELGMKIGIGAGPTLAARVGGAFGRWEYVIAGDALRQAVEAEQAAGRGEVVLSPEARAAIAPHAVASRPLPPVDWVHVQDPRAVEAALRVYVPDVVIAWLGEALHEWLAVLRPMSVLFVGIAGIEYGEAEVQPPCESPDFGSLVSTSEIYRLHAFMRRAQEIVQHYEGTINKLVVDDKGTVLLLLFGAPPRAHEDDPERALRCALDLQSESSTSLRTRRVAGTLGLQLAIGAATGRVFAGPVGSATRREYTVMGDTVNLAARLMGLAPPGQVRCDYETYHSARGRLAFDLLPPSRVKGKAGLIRIYRPTGEAPSPLQASHGLAGDRQIPVSGALIGRRAEVGRFVACLDAVEAGQSRILLVEGEAGIGKSRLVEELARLMRERGIAGLRGWGRSIEQRTPYRAWRDIFASFFDLDEVTDPAERRRRVQDYVHDVAPDLAERIPLLNDVLNLGFADNALTASLDAQLRSESLISLLLALLRAWAAERPLILVLEDAHWLDTLSWELTVQVARALTVARAPLLLVAVMRPGESSTSLRTRMEGEIARGEPQILAAMKETERMPLDSLSPGETVALAALRLGVPVDGLPAAVADLVRTRSGGNPFFAEELVYALRDNGLITVETEDGKARCVVSGDLERAAQALPDTIQGIVLSRIDRLSPEEQMTLKVAAVIGRTFVYTTLRDSLGEHMEVSDRLLRVHLERLTSLDLTPLEAPEPELTYIFKHIITQEVAYETLLFAQRRQLHHTVARWYERHFGVGVDKLTEAHPYGPAQEVGLASPLAPYSPLLVYHWHQAEDRSRERFYAGLAGRWAAAQFANVEAAGYFTRALELTPESDMAARYDLLLAREGVNDLRGERGVQAQDLVRLVLLAEEMDGDVHQAAGWKAGVSLRMANYMEATSYYSAALIAVYRAIAWAAAARDLAGETAGHIAWGRVLIRQGRFDEARAPLERALRMAQIARDRHGEANSLQQLGLVYLCQGNYPAARDHYQRAFQIYRADGYRKGEADSLGLLGIIHDELGDYLAARSYYEQSLAICQSIGDRRGATLTLNNLGVVYGDLGDYQMARDYHEQALDIRLAIGDRWGEANSLVNLGLVSHGLGDHRAACEHCQQALAIQRAIGDRRGEGYSLTYLGHALAGLGEWQAAARAYDEAMRLRHELGQHGLAIDDLAGLAGADLAMGHGTQALERTEEILAWIGTNGHEGIEYPLQVTLTCYRILQATAQGDPTVLARARSLLSTAHVALIERAAAIGDETLRLKFLQDVQAHREILAAWEENR